MSSGEARRRPRRPSSNQAHSGGGLVAADLRRRAAEARAVRLDRPLSVQAPPARAGDDRGDRVSDELSGRRRMRVRWSEVRPRRGTRAMSFRDRKDRLWLLAPATTAVLLLVPTASLSAGERRTADGSCPPEMSGQPLVKVPEIAAVGGKLRGTVLLRDEQEWIPFRVPRSAPSPQSTSQCVPQYVRVFRDPAATPPLDVGGYGMPMPGPTLRARVGDLVELTFINQIDASDFGDSIDRGENGTGTGCDETAGVYPGKDTFPDCFHGSSTGNIHFHGTHTNPNGTGDNVCIEVRPSLRSAGKPVFTQQSVRKPFDAFFAACEQRLRGSPLTEWPNAWSDLPKAYTSAQEALLKRYDKTITKKKLWP